MRLPTTLILALLLAACGDTTARYLVEPVRSEVRVRTPFERLLLRTVSLPTYAAAEEIAFQDADGVVRTSDQGLWADDPERAVTLAISRHLNEMISARVAPEPWPLPTVPEAVADIRVEQLLATNTGTFRLSGQYFVGAEAPEPPDNFDDPDVTPKAPPPPIRDKARLFDIRVPIAGEGLAGLSVAQADALRQLAEKIARDLAR